MFTGVAMGRLQGSDKGESRDGVLRCGLLAGREGEEGTKMIEEGREERRVKIVK